MKLAMIGLGKMGGNMVRRLVIDGHEVVAFNRSPEPAIALSTEFENVTAVSDLAELIKALEAPRVIWLMVPHQFVDQSIEDLLHAGMSKGDVLIDGGRVNAILKGQDDKIFRDFAEQQRKKKEKRKKKEFLKYDRYYYSSSGFGRAVFIF